MEPGHREMHEQSPPLPCGQPRDLRAFCEDAGRNRLFLREVEKVVGEFVGLAEHVEVVEVLPGCDLLQAIGRYTLDCAQRGNLQHDLCGGLGPPSLESPFVVLASTTVGCDHCPDTGTLD